MKKYPYKEVIDLKEERKEFALLWSGKSKKYEQYSDWENHIKEQLSCFSSSQELYNFKHYCINVSRSQEKAPDMYLSYVGLLIPIYLDTIFDGMPKLLTLLLFIAVLFYAIVQNKKMATESYVFRDIISIIDKAEGTIEFGQSAPQGQHKGESMKRKKMKKLIKKPFLWLVVTELLAAIILFFCGFRITYAPDLENSWEAISACAGWASVVVAGLAIYYAIRVPQKIAAEQNRIALFEKRHDFYITFCKCISFCRSLEIVSNGNEARRIFYHVFSEDPTELKDEAILIKITPIQMKTVAMMDQGIYLFDFETEMYIETILKNLAEVLSPTTSSDKFEEHRKLLIASGRNAEESLTPNLVEMLKYGE